MRVKYKKWLAVIAGLGFVVMTLTGCVGGKELEQEMTSKAQQGDPASQYALARMYFMSNGVDQSDRKGVLWLKKAAENGHPEAQTDLGDVYKIGLATRQNIVEADKWYTLAARQDFGRGIRTMKEVEHDMTAEQIAKAKSLADAWRPRGK